MTNGLIIYDAVACTGAYFLALLLRFDFHFSAIPAQYFDPWLKFAPFYAVFCVIVFWLLKLYKSIWRFASFTELERITVATFITTVAHVILITVFLHRMPISYYIIGAFLQFGFIVVVRFSYRFVLLLRGTKKQEENLQRVMLIGAGAAGQMILRDIRRSGEVQEKVACIIDDNPNKWGRDIEGVRIVGGREEIPEAAIEYNIDKIYLAIPSVSSNPVNVMGASKRLCEMIVQTFARKVDAGQASQLPDLQIFQPVNLGKHELTQIPKEPKTSFAAVRFGNVLGSNGSVIPRFREQIAAGGPVTVTHPEIIRYFMTIPEAASLVLQAATFGSDGNIFVLDMGTPVKIADLAKNMIRLSGLKPGQDIEIVYTGLRPGEKLYEERLMDEEGLQTTKNELISIGQPIVFDENEFLDQLQTLAQYAYEDRENIREVLAEIVPTYAAR